jgi:hypothetical protein
MTVAFFFGLMLFKSWARHIYLANLIVSLVLYPFFGLSVVSGFGQLFYDVSTVFSGVILSLIYYAPAVRYFEESNI